MPDRPLLLEYPLDFAHEVAFSELPRREIYAHAQPSRLARQQPHLRLSASLAKRPNSEWNNDACLLGKWNEVVGMNQLETRRLPPNERLKTYNLIGAKRHNRLIMKYNFFAAYRAT
jgi:hypothetical protein